MCFFCYVISHFSCIRYEFKARVGLEVALALKTVVPAESEAMHAQKTPNLLGTAARGTSPLQCVTTVLEFLSGWLSNVFLIEPYIMWLSVNTRRICRLFYS